jgi:photosynthetic reaction center cytochrome c subunit
MNRRRLALTWIWIPIAFVSIAATTRSDAPPAAPQTQVSTVQQDNDAFVQRIAREIAGHEQEPAEKVFKNIHILNTTPAGRLLLIMNVGYSRALGVSCTHCHVERDFSLDDKRPKRAAREMAAMHRRINEQLATMQNLEPKPQGRFINCSTCHRGAVDPLSSDK